MNKAFLLANSNYGQHQLSNPINDGILLTSILEYKGFQVEQCFNKSNQLIQYEFAQFKSTLNDGDAVLFFYAGHAIEYRDVNLLLSIDYLQLSSVDKCISIDFIQSELSQVNPSGTKIIIVDACRNNGGAYENNTLISPQQVANTLIAFSTAPGTPAADGVGENSSYMKALVDNIKKYNNPISQLFIQVRESVLKASEFKQVPWEHSSLTLDFSFDNIEVPKNENRLNDITLKPCYSIIAFGNQVYFGGQGGLIVGDTEKKDQLKVYKSLSIKEIEDVASNGNKVVVVGDCKLCIMNGDPLKESELKKYDFNIYTVSINTDGVVFLAGRSTTAYLLNSPHIKNIDLKEEVLVQIYERDELVERFGDDLTIQCSAFSPSDKNLLVFGGSDNILCMKNIQTSKVLYLNTDHSLFSYTNSVAFSHNGKYLVTSHESGKVKVWDVVEGQLLRKITYQANPDGWHILDAKFSPDDSYITFGEEGSVVFYDYIYEEIIGKVKIFNGDADIYALDFDANGSLLVSLNTKCYQLNPVSLPVTK